MKYNLKLPNEFKGLLTTDTRLKYYSRNPLKHLLIKRFFNKLIKEIEELKPREILEIGCGDGIAGYLISRSLQRIDYYGADLHEQSLITASKILTRNLVKLDARTLPYVDKSFDLVLFLEVFEHIHSWEKAFQEGARVAKKGMIFSVPSYPWYQLSNLVFLKNLTRLGEHPEHVQQFSRRRIERELASACKYLNLNLNIRISFPWIIGKAIF